MNTELKKQNLPQQVHLSQYSQIYQQSICRRAMWKELASMLTMLGEQSGEKEAAGLLQQLPCLPSPTLPHIMVMISTTFESPKAKNCSHITEPAVKLSLIYHKLFQMGSKFFKKTHIPRRYREKRSSTCSFTFKKAKTYPSSSYQPASQRGGSAHLKRPPTNAQWLIYIKH